MASAPHIAHPAPQGDLEQRRRGNAQRRADRIRAFREELSDLAAEGANPLSPEQELALAAHHDRLLATLAREFDVDRSAQAGQLSRGLKIASVFGAGTLIAAITSVIDRFWGGMTLPSQVTLLTLFPLLALAGVQAAAMRERTLYVASLFAVVATGTAWVAIFLITRLLDLPFSVLLLWPGVLFGVALAVSYGFRLVWAISLAGLILATAGGFFAASGTPWTLVAERLEPMMLSAFVLMVAARWLAAAEGFDATARLTGLVLGLGTLLVLATADGLSLLQIAPRTSTAIYQGVMFVACLILLAVGLRRGNGVVVTTTAVFFAIFLLIRYVVWFWDAWPAWAFFLTLSVLAFASIWLLRRMRRRLEAA